jgi:MFS family permease
MALVQQTQPAATRPAATRPAETRQSGGHNILLIIAAGCGIGLISFGVRSDFGLFLLPMVDARDFTKADFGFAMALQALLWGLGQPFAGAMADRFGTARVLAAGGLLYAAGVILGALSTSAIELYLTLGVMVGFGMSSASFMIVMGAFARLVPAEQRSWALGIATASGSLGQFLLTPLGAVLLEAFGWETAMIMTGLLCLAIMPLATVLKSRKETLSVAGAGLSWHAALAEAFAQRAYWLLILGFFVCGFQVTFIQTYVPAFVQTRGIDLAVGAWAVSLIGGFNIIGAYTAGVLGGKYSKKYLLVGIYLGRCVVITLFMLIPMTATTVLIFSAVMGILWLSTVPLTSGLVAQIFGIGSMSMLFGVVFVSHQFGSFLGVWLAGYLFETTGSFDAVWWISVALGLFAAAVHWPIDERSLNRTAVARA